MIKLGIIGYPIEHSLSPLLHEYLLKQLQLEGSYETFAVTQEELGEQISYLRVSGFRGFNVTIPHKQRVITYLDGMDEEAEFIGAVNTVYLQGDRLWGSNTDHRGFIQTLMSSGLEITGKTALVLGAGGAARAVIFGLIEQGIKKIFIANRTPTTATKFIAEIEANTNFRTNVFTAIKFDEDVISQHLNECQILVNATSLGMWPEHSATPFTFKNKVDNLVVADLVYNPVETQFLKCAKSAGAQTVDGLDMLIFQGVEAMRIWLGLSEAFAFEHSDLRALLTKGLE